MGSGAQFFFLGQSWQNVGVKLGVLETPVDFLGKTAKQLVLYTVKLSGQNHRQSKP